MDVHANTIAIYTRQALEGMGRALDRFDDATVNIRPHGDETNSAAVLITHACASATFWFEHVGLGRDSERNRDTEFVVKSSVADLRSLLSTTADRLEVLAAELDAGPTATDHALRAFLPCGDESDGAIVLHALEELFQHLGHLELTADAVGSALD